MTQNRNKNKGTSNIESKKIIKRLIMRTILDLKELYNHFIIIAV